MQDFGDIINNRVLLVALVACVTAQALKLVVDLGKNRKVNTRVLVETGGMPSAPFSIGHGTGNRSGANDRLVNS
ncbi:divergent PAP2 family protein [Kovacikia minuta]|uniref:divergent PAP2 family protein n=1 Tax=Kovacikia minuta TaxID=2931930 RepID=UPI0036F30572